ncbi:DUF3800 domain-containing protein [Aestuariimicrobium sp. T2.26MG-19.2B]|uniref:DUF3800 domain-containing protein n=1 Tax=Aestuariimicrobium sp. T2.26MG-19.2B TaxID=3040679 RepID=UPI0024801153|nr:MULTISPECIES: DUF3800 domain-containing protein [Aestuariimicrobium]
MYVDDSGHPQSGLVVYGWVEFRPDRWSSVLQAWLDTRKRLWREFGVPITQELHATDYINGRGRISDRIPERHVHAGIEHWKDFGREVALACLETLRCTENLRVGAVWRRGVGGVANTRRDAYSALIQQFEGELAETGSLALVFMDGNGSDTSYRATHRNLRLADRRVVEDAIHMDSRTSQLVQMADLVAWTANVHIDRYEGNQFAWEWYSTHLGERDPHRGPREI